MTDLTKDFEKLSLSDLVLAAEAKGIKVTGEVDRESLLKKLEPKGA